jgi:hypothetical protein
VKKTSIFGSQKKIVLKNAPVRLPGRGFASVAAVLRAHGIRVRGLAAKYEFSDLEVFMSRQGLPAKVGLPGQCDPSHSLAPCSAGRRGFQLSPDSDGLSYLTLGQPPVQFGKFQVQVWYCASDSSRTAPARPWPARSFAGDHGSSSAPAARALWRLEKP